MKTRIFFGLILAAVVLFCTQSLRAQTDTAAKEVVVYYCSEITPENILKLYNALGVNQTGKVGLKVHFGERGNENFLKPDLLRPLVEQVHPTFVETNVLYVSDRRFTKSHIALAKEHGFTFAPIDILDDEGETEYNAENMGFKYCKKIKTGSHFENYDSYIIYSHFKGHGSSGFGGAIKNVGMGMASPGGKMAIHASNYPCVKQPDKCVHCYRCVQQCPRGAITITDNGPVIDTTKCIGCAKCLAECPLRIFAPNYAGYDQQAFMDKLIEYAKVLASKRPMVYINVMANISTTCDCSAHAPKPFMQDVGAVASTDMIAIDQACLDLTSAVYGCQNVFEKVNQVGGESQLKYGEDIGLGHTRYVLVDVVTGKRISLQEAVQQSKKVHQLTPNTKH